MPDKIGQILNKLDELNMEKQRSREPIKWFIKFFIFEIILALVLFLTAGTFLWFDVWIIIIIFNIFVILTCFYLWKKDPELLEKRSKMEIKEKFDKIVILVLFVSVVVLFLIPGLDYRFQWSKAPLFIKVIGYVCFLISLLVHFLVVKENTFLSKAVEIQEERNQTVITTGPYKFVRHPMYTSVILTFISLCLSLGSYFSLIPASVAVIAFIYRTKREDDFLKQHLKGYEDYTKRTRYRLIPGIW